MTDKYSKEQNNKCHDLLNSNDKYFECSECGMVIVKSAIIDKCPLCGRFIITNLEKH